MAEDGAGDAGSGNGRRTSADHPVRDVVQRLEEMSDRREAKLGDLVHAFGATSFAPALLIPAILVTSPLSGVPLFSSFCGVAIVLISAQMIAKRNALWLPGFVTERKVSGERLGNALRRMRRVADFLDRMTRPDRLRGLPGRGDPRVAGVLALVCGALMPVLELVPFSSSVLGAAVICFSISLLTKDGLFVLLGLTIMALAAVLPVMVGGVVW